MSVDTILHPLPTSYQTSKLRLLYSKTPQLITCQSVIEQNRLDSQAAAIIEMIGFGPCLAPLQSVAPISRVVDVGCGTGVATIQIATMIPSAKVYGLDISLVPEAVQKLAPANVAWAVGNVLEADRDEPDNEVMRREIFDPCGLDYIFGRMLFLGIDNWPRYFSIAYHALAPGGIIEHQDLDWDFYRVGTSQRLSDEWEWHQAVVAGFKKSGLSRYSGSDAAPLMRNLGLEIISVQTFEFSFVPSANTPNSQAMGRYVQSKLVPHYPELLRKMLGAQCIVGEELERLTRDCLRDIASEEGLHQKYTVTVGRKPLKS